MVHRSPRHPARVRTRTLITQANVASSSAGGDQEHVDIASFAVMRATSLSSITVHASAIAPVIEDPTDSRLRRGQVARPSPWTNVD